MLLLGLALLGGISWAAAQRTDGRLPVIATSTPPPPATTSRPSGSDSLPAPVPPGLPIIASSDPPPSNVRTSAFSSPVPALAVPANPVPRDPSWSLAVEKSGPSKLIAGLTVQYEIMVRNTGTVPLEEVRIEEELPAETRLVASEPRADAIGSALVWNLARLEPGAQQRFRMTIRPERDGTLRALPKVGLGSAAPPVKPSSDEPSASRANRPLLVLRVTGPERVQVGEPIEFLVELANAGPTPATNVVLHDALPEGLQHPQGPKIQADLGTVGPGETKTLHLTTSALQSGRFVNEIHATGDGNLRATDLATVIVVEKHD
jgi:uncharacterized repeat protein (TIGR01451 family)